MAQFLINKAGVYYLTTGKLLKYDAKEAKNDKEKEGVEEVRRKFEQIENEPHTWYRCVEITEASFGPMNTEQVD